MQWGISEMGLYTFRLLIRGRMDQERNGEQPWEEDRDIHIADNLDYFGGDRGRKGRGILGKF